MTERVLGPTGGRRRKRLAALVPLMVLAATGIVFAFAMTASAAKPPSGTPSGPFPVPTGTLGVNTGFEDNDGNMTPDSTLPTGAPTNGGGYTVGFDWNSLEPSGLNWGPFNSGNQSGTGRLTGGISTNGGWKTLGITAPIGNAPNQNSFAGGTKQDNECASVISQGVQNKDDLRAIYLAAKHVTISGSDHVIVNLNWERAPQNNTSASAHVAFEFNQGTSACGSGSDGLVHRSTANGGDLLLVYDFTGGNTLPTLSLSRWIASGTCEVGADSPPCWGTFTTLSPTQAEANVDDGLTHNCPTDFCGPNETDINTNSPTLGTIYQLPANTRDCLAAGSGSPALGACSPNISSPTSGGYSLGTSEFGEAGVDLTAAGVFTSGSCLSFGQVEAVSRSSGNSSQAAMEKLVGPAQFSIGGCTASTSTQMQKDGTAATEDTSSYANMSNLASVTSGTWVRDKATVTVTGTSSWSGKVNFYLCFSSSTTLTSCDNTGTHILPADVGVSNSGATATSGGTRVTAAGSYCWAAYFTHSTPSDLPDGDPSTTGECFTVTAPTSIATNPWVFPQDRAVISASAGGNLAGSVAFKLYDNSTDCTANTSTGLLYSSGSISVSGASPQTIDTSNSSYRVTSSTANNLYWRVTYTSTNNLQTNSSSVCVENMGVSITADGTVTFS